MADRRHGAPTPPTEQEVVAEDWSGRDLSGRAWSATAFLDVESGNWSLVGLPGADLRRSSLRRTSLAEADLSGARLDRAVLRDVDLRGAWLHKASLVGADLRGTTLEGIDPLTVELRDATVDVAQAITLAEALGLRVEI